MSRGMRCALAEVVVLNEPFLVEYFAHAARSITFKPSIYELE